MTTRREFFVKKMNATEHDLNYLEAVDPSGKRWNWLLRGHREGWFTGVAVPELQEALKRFNRLSQSPRFREASYHPDLNTYTWEALQEALGLEASLRSNKQRAQEFEGCELMYEDGESAVYKVMTPKGAELAGSGTSWCTTACNSTAEGYLKSGHLYIAHIWGIPYAQIHPLRKEWNLAANIITGLDIFGTHVWTDRVGYDLFMKAARKCKDPILTRGLKSLPLVTIEGNRDSSITALMNPFKRLNKAIEREMIKEGDLPRGYFRRFRKQRDLELEQFLAVHGSAEICMDYLENVTNEVGPIFEKKLQNSTQIYARYINRCQPATFNWSGVSYTVLNQWLALKPNVFNASAVRYARREIDDQVIRDYLRRCGTTSPTYHRQLISAQDIENLFLYEEEVLKSVDPRTLATIAKIFNSSSQIRQRLGDFAGRVWLKCPELRPQLPLKGGDMISRVAIEATERLPELERAILSLNILDFDFHAYRHYIREAAQPEKSDAVVLKMCCRNTGYSPAGGSLEGYLLRYPRGEARQNFLKKLLKGGLKHHHESLVRLSAKSLRSRDIAEVTPDSQWGFLVALLRNSNRVACAAIRIHQTGRLSNFNWGVFNQWRVSPYVKKFFTFATPGLQMDSQQPGTLLWISINAQPHGFDPKHHPELMDYFNHNNLTQAVAYATDRIHQASLILSGDGDSIDWCGWGVYTSEDGQWSIA